MYGYRSKTKLRLADLGKGGLDELSRKLTKRGDKMYYIFIRLKDNNKVFWLIKKRRDVTNYFSQFALLTWLGPQLPVNKRNKIVTHRPSVRKMFQVRIFSEFSILKLKTTRTSKGSILQPMLMI